MRQDNTKKKNKTVKWVKIGAWVVGLALLLFVGLFFFTYWLEGKLERMVSERSNGVYKLQLYGFDVSPFIGSASVDSLSLVPDYQRWEQVQQQDKKAPRMLLDVQSGPIRIQNLNTFGILFGNDISLNELSLQQPKLLMTVMRRDTTEQHKPMHQTVSDYLQGLHVGKIDVNNAGLKYREEHKTDAYLFAIKSFNLTVDDFRLDSKSFHAEERAYYAKQMKFAAAKASYQMPDGLYKAEADSLFMSTREQLLLAKQVKYTPLGSAADLSKAKGRAVTRTSIKMPLLRISGLNYRQHSLYNRIIARHVLINEPTLDAYKDKQSFQNKGKKPLPHEMVQNVKTPFHVDSVVVRQGYVRYAELVPKAKERGHITFNSLEATLTNLTNMPEQISVENPAVVQASTLVMGKAPLSVTIRLPLLQQNGYHTLRGSIGEANPEILNSILVPTSFIRIESGHISRGEFSAELTNDRADGTMTIIYSNLDVEMLSKGSGGEQGLGMEILSEVADWVAIKDSNPKNGEEVRIGNITVTRNAQKSVFNYWKNCLASGFISSIGLESKAKK